MFAGAVRANGLEAAQSAMLDHRLTLANPIVAILVSYLATACVVVVTDTLALPGRFRRRVRMKKGLHRRNSDLAVRLVSIGYVYGFFFAISWRPIYCFLGTVTFFAVFTAISRIKHRFIREPLIFSDIALAYHLLKHKEMFYASWMGGIFWFFGFLYIFGLSALFYLLEPSVLPSEGAGWAILLVLALWIAPLVALLLAPYRRWLAAWAQRIVGPHDPAGATVRFGTFGYVLIGFLSWLDVPGVEAGAMSPTSPDLKFGRAPVVVVWQSESFLDMRRLGVDGLDLPCLDALRRRATSYGLMGQVFEGGYTMRTEFAVLTGLDPAAIGLDAAHPYLRARRYGSDAWPSRLRQSGWRTHFLHPYDRTFFLRHRAIPELGFERLTMLDDFGHVATPEVPYVTDRQLTDRVIDLCRNEPSKQPSFIFAASMGNHGPWNDFRGGRWREPVDLYCHLLEHADAALGMLVEALDRLDRPVMLVFYGDHAPLLKGFADPFPDPRTDYLIVPLGAQSTGESDPTAMTDIDAWHLMSTAFAQLSERLNNPAAGDRTPAAPDGAS